MMRSLHRAPLSLAVMLSALCCSVQHGEAQVLNLGDPPPPILGESAACRTHARSLRAQAKAIRSQPEQGSSAADQCVRGAQAEWRELAAHLLDRGDPLAECEAVLSGWRLVRAAEALDADIALMADAPGLDAEAREDALWMLRRFAAAPLTDDAACSASAEILCEALAPLSPAREPALTGIAALRAKVGNDVDLNRAAQWLDRLAGSIEAGGHVSPRTRLTFDRLVVLIDQVHTIDRTTWLAGPWAPRRSAAIEQCLSEVLAPGGGGGERCAAVASIAGAAERLAAHALRPAGVRLRAGEYTALVQRLAGAALDRGERAPWPLLLEALDSAAARRDAPGDATQRDLRHACKALDDQSDQLERLMAEALWRMAGADAGSDPAWATLVGGHRLNIAERRLLVSLQAGIEAIATLDRRAPALIWPRLAPLAQGADEPRRRAALMAMAREINAFAQGQLALADEEAWRDDSSWAAELAGEHRVAVVERLDSLRRQRAREIAEGAAPSGAAADLASLRDLFRLAQVWRRLAERAAPAAAAAGADGLLWPEALPARRAAALRSDLQRAASLAAGGGVPFQRDVDEARRRAGDAIVLADLLRDPSRLAVIGRSPCLEMLEHIAHGFPKIGGRDERRRRLMQWCILHFETEAAPGLTSPVATYRDFLTMRLAEAIWLDAE